ncbi:MULTISPECIES: metal ABC transporter ATP-binding protein [Staphylococcus]|uniref:Manganese ABC transporter, ATP-binding protein SitB n=2 Tax=Staphylococcus nepalensis TaxID=214473 RepID=A0A291JI50_9STAP|nr:MULTISPECIES: metal ABC transporter ATP-binding protein [Staphylococcus]VDG65973.1 zinc transport system ATP-binding protein TroB [Lacrimispora indolis]ATH59098.1 manganese ABC transporter ATP-binding protein [Staphylococcus nepalensis]ATH64189.1 manganese ABC transporter ATP-binding protein [Staphylococcus nepalensis]AWI43549.1 manganese ABC transporter ATP-binding protein [Staphylococcus nepalensis]MBO1220852.1 metal ABC transporter ATP-binding protein [Staphylococcus nepalensis]
MLETKNITVTYNNTIEALKDISLEVPPGNIYGIIGPNGAGKSTLIKAMLDLLPHSGYTLYNDKPIKTQRKNLSYVEQKSNIDTTFPMKVIDCVILGIFPTLNPLQRPGKHAKQKAEEALKKVNMYDYRNRQISDLSGGQFQRILIARTIIQDADLVFLDEPFVGIDITSENIIIKLLKEMARQGRTILIVHHDLSKVNKYFDGLILLNKSLIAYGATSDVFTGEHIKRAFGSEILVSSEQGGADNDSAIRE